MDDNKAEPPAFATDEEAAEFWETHDNAPYWDDMETVEVRVDPRARTQALAVRIRGHHLDAIKRVAERRGVSYHALVREWLAERLREEGALEGPGT